MNMLTFDKDVIKKIIYSMVLFIAVSCCKYESNDLFDQILNKGSHYVVVFGDVQEYTNGDSTNLIYFTETINWISNQIQSNAKIDLILQVGDITNTNLPKEYEIYSSRMSSIEKSVPIIACVGNHDYTWNSKSKIEDRASSLFNKYVSYENLKVISRFENGKNENIVAEVKIDDEVWYVISLEFGPRKEVLTWISEFVEYNQEKKFILLTHEYLTRKGVRITKDSYASSQLINTSYSTPEELWKLLISPNDNIKCVVCGHNGFSKYLFSENDFGRGVPQILFNLQYQPHGGDGWIQLWEFPKKSSIVKVNVYNTISRQIHPDTSFSFQFKY